MSWPLQNIGEVIAFKGGGTPRKDVDEYWSDDIPWASVKDFKSLEISATKDHISQKGLESSAANLIPKGNVIIPTRMALGKAAINSIDVAINQDLRALIPKIPFDSRFLLHAMISLAPQIERQGSGATVKGITQARLAAIKIPTPPIEEQKRIAGILDAADELRTKRRESLAQLDALLQSTFLDMFGDPVTNPKGWDVVTLGNIATRITKGQSPKWQGFTYQDEGLLFVTSENVRDGFLDIAKPKFVELEFNEKLKGSTLRSGDLLINLVGASIGRSCIFNGYQGLANVNQAVGVVSLGDPVFATFVIQMLQTQQGRALLTGRIVEAARANISLKNLRELVVPAPPLELQSEFSNRVLEIQKQRDRNNAQLTELDTLFASLQSRAFRGEL